MPGINQNAGAGGVYLNDQPGCNPCSVDTNPSCTFNGTHNVPEANLSCPPFSTTGSYYLQDYVNQLAGREIPIKRVFTQRKGIMNFLTDFETSMDESGNLKDMVVLKEMNGLQLAQSVDGTFYQWGEWYYERGKFHVTQNYTTPTNTIQIGIETAPGVYTPSLGGNFTSKARQNIIVGDTVRILQRDPNEDPDCCVAEIVKSVIAVDPVNNTITLEPTFGGGPSSFRFSAGDTVELLWNGRNDCEKVTKEAGQLPPKTRVAYIQHLDHKITFTKKELNTAYMAMDAKKYIQLKLENMNIERVEMIGNLAYLGRNRRMSDPGQPTKGETQGILSAIREAQLRNPSKNLIVDLAQTVNDDDRVRIIYDQLLAVQDSGWINNNEPVILLMNRIAASQVTKMQRAWNNLLGVQVNSTDYTNKVFTYPVIKTPTGIDMVNAYCEHLSQLYPKEGMIIMFPKSALSIYSRENAKVIPSGSTLGVEKTTLVTEFKEISAPDDTECRTYRVMLEFAIIVAGVDSGAFRWIKGLNAC